MNGRIPPRSGIGRSDGGHGVYVPDADSGEEHSRRSRRARPHRLRLDGHRQDRRVPAADPAAAARRPRGGCRALILSPTRELALQIDEQALALGYHVGISAAAVVGGVDMGPQERALREGSRSRRGHAGTTARSPALQVRRSDRRRGAGARRSRPHARHGLPARRAPDPRGAAGESADAAVLGHAVTADPRARRRDSARPGDGDGGSSRAGQRHPPARARRGAGRQGCAARDAAAEQRACARCWCS